MHPVTGALQDPLSISVVGHSGMQFMQTWFPGHGLSLQSTNLVISKSVAYGDTSCGIQWESFKATALGGELLLWNRP